MERPGTVIRKKALRHAFALLPAQPSLVVDIGGREGTVVQQLPSSSHASHVIIDVDYNAIVSVPRSLRPVCADGGKLPLRDGCADLVLCLDVIEHIVDEQPLLLETERILSPSGVALFTTTAEDFSLPLMRRERVNEMWGHVRTGYTSTELQELLRRADLTVVATGRYFSAATRFAYSLLFMRKLKVVLGTRLSLGLLGAVAMLDQRVPLDQREHWVIARKTKSHRTQTLRK